VDFIFSYSSIEHSGLGRYGDPLNPYGDLEAIAQMHCLLKNDGILMLGIPMGYDDLEFNAHRIYGPHRLWLILMHWEVLGVLSDTDIPLQNIKEIGRWDIQPILVLKKKAISQKN
jgi:hypothetical protein